MRRYYDHVWLIAVSWLPRPSRNDIGSPTARSGATIYRGGLCMRAFYLSAVPLVCALGMPADAQLLNQKAIPAAMAMTIASQPGS